MSHLDPVGLLVCLAYNKGYYYYYKSGNRSSLGEKVNKQSLSQCHLKTF